MSARYTQDQYDLLQKTMSREVKPRRATPQEVRDRIELERIQDQTRQAQKPQKSDKINKYRNKRVEIAGIRFDSAKEAKHWDQLKLLEKAGAIKNLQRQVMVNLEVNGQKVCAVKPDFVFTDIKTGKIIYHDVKGMKFGAAYEMFRLKKKLFFALTGNDIIEI